MVLAGEKRAGEPDSQCKQHDLASQVLSCPGPDAGFQLSTTTYLAQQELVLVSGFSHRPTVGRKNTGLSFRDI